MIAALIFDFDGLLLDTETPALQSWQTIYASYGHELTFEQWQAALGRRANQGFDALAHLATLVSEPFDHAQIFQRRQNHKYELCKGLPLQQGVTEILAQARALELPCAVASSSNREWVEGWLEKHQLMEQFATICTGDQVAETKPAPDLFLLAAAKLGIEPAACLVFEDSPNGILAARAAGMRCVAVPCALTARLELPPVDLLLPSLDALPLTKVIASVEKRPL